MMKMRKGLGLGVLAVLIAALVPSEAAAYKPKDARASSNMWVALISCKAKLPGGPGLLVQSDYDNYIDGRDRALALDPELKNWDELESHQMKRLGMSPKELLVRCDRLFADYAAGVDAEKQPAVNPLCLPSFEHYMMLTRSYLDKSKTTEAKAFWARQNYEKARYTLLRKGALPGTRSCNMNDGFKASAAPLKQKLAELEVKVLGLEAEKNVVFAGLEKGEVPIYNEASSGKRVERADRL